MIIFFLVQGMDIYDAMLNQTNVGGNNNKFYVIQALGKIVACMNETNVSGNNNNLLSDSTVVLP